jgi:hypothetical protein
MALTKLTKHVLHGSFIVQMVYRDISDMSGNQTSAKQWGETVNLTPQYADSILEVHFSGTVRSPTTYQTGSARQTLNLYVNNQNEYVINTVNTAGNQGHAYNQTGQHMGSSVSLFHRHLPGTTNQQSVNIRITRDNNNGGTYYCTDGFMMVKEISAGVTTGTGGNHVI